MKTKEVNEGITHWEGCYKEHHDCAVAAVEYLRLRNTGLEEQAQHLRGDVLQFSELANECIKELKIIQEFIETTDGIKLRPDELISTATINFFGKFTRTMRDIENCLRIINKHNDLGEAAYDVKDREMEGWVGLKVTAYSDAVRRLKGLVNL